MTKKYLANFAIDADENTLKQFENCTAEDFVIKGALMPDAHSGYVAPIGSVLISKEYIVPAWVGYDIGCGMIACKIEGEENLTEKIKQKKEEIYEKVKKSVPMGEGKYNHNQNISKETKEKFKELIMQIKDKELDTEINRYIKNKGLANIGTLGGGNHFIELGISENTKEPFLIVHSGSRGVGHKIATNFMKKASNKDKGYEATYPLKEIEKEGKDYLTYLNFALEFALLNRLEMAKKIEEILKETISTNIKINLWCNKNHNHAVKENNSFIHRKGATPAKKGEKGVIPANMRDGCFLVEGLGNKDFLESSSHGAGRKLSRNQAKKQITLDKFKETMKGITGTVNEKTIDEAPDAYKNIYDVMEAQKTSIKTLDLIKPIINWKG